MWPQTCLAAIRRTAWSCEPRQAPKIENEPRALYLFEQFGRCFPRAPALGILAASEEVTAAAAAQFHGSAALRARLSHFHCRRGFLGRGRHQCLDLFLELLGDRLRAPALGVGTTT